MRLTDKINKITQAISKNQSIETIYHGGRNPGKSRIIYPKFIELDNFHGVCFNDGIQKKFFLNKIDDIRIINDESGDTIDYNENTLIDKDSKYFEIYMNISEIFNIKVNKELNIVTANFNRIRNGKILLFNVEYQPTTKDLKTISLVVKINGVFFDEFENSNDIVNFFSELINKSDNIII
jgi:hypothetical protein